jgi:hypothetical protein
MKELQIGIRGYAFTVRSICTAKDEARVLSEWHTVFYRALSEGFLVPKEAEGGPSWMYASQNGEVFLKCSPCGCEQVLVVPAYRTWKDKRACVKCGALRGIGQWHSAGVAGGPNYDVFLYWNAQRVCVQGSVPATKPGVVTIPPPMPAEPRPQEATGATGTRDPDAYLRKQIDDNLRGLFG